MEEWWNESRDQESKESHGYYDDEKEDFIKFLHEYKEAIRDEAKKGLLIPFPSKKYKRQLGSRNLKSGTQQSLYNISHNLVINKNQLPDWKKNLIDKELVKKGYFIWKTRRESKWYVLFNFYKDWKKRTKKNIPPARMKVAGWDLNAWYNTTRSKYNGELGPLSDWQLELCRSINFDFKTTDYFELWLKKYYSYKKIYEKYKGRIPQSRKDQQHPAISWFAKQKSLYREGKLDKNKINLIEEIRYWSWAKLEEKQVLLENLLFEYLEKNKVNNIGISKVYKGERIGGFLKNLREKFETGQLDKKLEKKLNYYGVNLIPKKINEKGYKYY